MNKKRYILLVISVHMIGFILMIYRMNQTFEPFVIQGDYELVSDNRMELSFYVVEDIFEEHPITGIGSMHHVITTHMYAMNEEYFGQYRVKSFDVVFSRLDETGDVVLNDFYFQRNQNHIPLPIGEIRMYRFKGDELSDEYLYLESESFSIDQCEETFDQINAEYDVYWDDEYKKMKFKTLSQPDENVFLSKLYTCQKNIEDEHSTVYYEVKDYSRLSYELIHNLVKEKKSK